MLRRIGTVAGIGAVRDTGSGNRSMSRGHDGRKLEEQAGALFGHCLSAFHSFQGLDQLAEDMRILSLNAELAAGRAGQAGVAVRALTQYTRQLVSQLNRLQGDMRALRRATHDISARTLRDLQRLRLLGDAHQRCLHQGSGGISGADSLLQAELEARGDCGRLMRVMMTNTHHLSTHAGRIRQVAEQSNGIATNIAIEAAAAGRHEGEFRNVANTMKTYIATLQSMVERADHSVRRAEEIGRGLTRRLGAETSGAPAAAPGALSGQAA
jgi:hypothetical protein